MSKRRNPKALADDELDAASGGASIPAHTPEWSDPRTGDPGRPSGELTAHEASHVVQAKGSGKRAPG